jgi:hypothetical protein
MPCFETAELEVVQLATTTAKAVCVVRYFQDRPLHDSDFLMPDWIAGDMEEGNYITTRTEQDHRHGCVL